MRSPSRPAPASVPVLGGLLAFFLCSGGCGGEEQNLEDRFFQCRDLVEDKESRPESLLCFSKDSRAVLQGLLALDKQTAGFLNYMRNYGKLLSYDDVLAPPDVRDDCALLLVGKGRRQETIFLVREDDQWVIDAFELAGFWAPLDEKEGQ